MLKVHIWPTPAEIREDNGIGRIVAAQYKYLPDFGIDLVPPQAADVIAVHTQQNNLPRVDVLHCHGLYWTGDPGSGEYSSWHSTANERVIQAARRAGVITVPSDWVAEPFRRDMRINPVVLGHGIDRGEWKPKENKGYVLWNKNRDRDVCDPTPPALLAQAGVQVVTTFAPENVNSPTLHVIGPTTHDKMREIVQHADIYLATVKETWGIATAEALASGVPVLGYAWGGTADLVRHKQTGYLVEPGDIEGLIEGVQWIRENRIDLSRNALEWADRWDWPNVMQEYAFIYKNVQGPTQPKVSIVIPCHNYGRYLHEAVGSAMAQEITCEVIVVDDASTDNSASVARKLQEHYGENRLKVIALEENMGVAFARNKGIHESTGDLIICLDADDQLDEEYVARLLPAFEANPDLGIAYTGITLMDTNGANRQISHWPPEFSWEGLTYPHVPPANCIPSAAMFRKKMWERVGGYRQDYAPGEDVEFWVRGLSTGWTCQQVTDKPLYIYRVHPQGAHRTKPYVAIDPYMPWMRDKQFPMAAPAKEVPPVRSYSQPQVSVIIPVGPGHEMFVSRAIESVLGQNFRNWELIVVWDSEEDYREYLEPYPFLKIVLAGESGAGKARNLGLDRAKAPLCMFLDADDYLAPKAISRMLEVFATKGGRYVYTSYFQETQNGARVMDVPHFDPAALLNNPQFGVTVLMGTVEARRLRFDENLPVLEDWDFFMRAAIDGILGVYLPEALYVVSSNGNRTRHLTDDLLSEVRGRYTEYAKGEKTMAACCGGSSAANVLLAAKAAIGQIPPEVAALRENRPFVTEGGNNVENTVRMEFTGIPRGAVSYGGRGVSPSGTIYRGGNNPYDRYIDAKPEDVKWLESLSVWKQVPRPTVTAPKPMFKPEETQTPVPVEVVVPDEVLEDEQAPEDLAAQVEAELAAIPEEAKEEVTRQVRRQGRRGRK